MLVYNTRQISGIKDLVYKAQVAQYLTNQIENSADFILIDRNERDWTINELRDIRVNYDIPMFIKRVDDLQAQYFIDKIVNAPAIDVNKDWTQLESFRDKFLVIRLIFDNFDNVKILMNFSFPDSNLRKIIKILWL